MKIRFCCLSVMFFVQGCVSTAKYEFDTSLSGTAAPRLVDNRSEKDKIRTNTCENGGIGNLGDANIAPNKMTLLANRMAAGGQLPGGAEVKVGKFNLYLVYSRTCANLKTMAQAGAVAGVLGGLVSYGLSEASGEGVACQLEFELNRKAYAGKSFIEAQKGIDALTGPSVSTKLLIAPMQSAVDKCIADALGKAGAPPAQ